MGAVELDGGGGHGRPRVADDELRDVTSSGRSTTRATAPRSIASGANAWPSSRSPWTQKKSVPGAAARESYASSRMSTGPDAGLTTCAGASAAVTRSRSTPGESTRGMRCYRRRNSTTELCHLRVFLQTYPGDQPATGLRSQRGGGRWPDECPDRTGPNRTSPPRPGRRVAPRGTGGRSRRCA